MKIKKQLRVGALLGLCFVGIAWSAQDVGTEDSAPAQRPVTVIALRHAEKGTEDPRDPELTEAGARRADALARLLSRGAVSHVFSTDYRRTQATVAPLAKSQELEVASYSPRDLSGFVEELRALPPGSVAVVSGHSNTTPGLVLALGGELVGLDTVRGTPSLGEGEYDRLFLVTLSERAGAESCVELRYGE